MPEPAQLTTARALGLDPLEAQIRQVFFFDTPDLALDEQGLVVRARRVAEEGRRLGGQAAAGRAVRAARRRCAGRRASASSSTRRRAGSSAPASFKGVPATGLRAARWRRAARSVRKLFSKEQQALFAEHAPEGIELDDLTAARAALRPQAEVRAARASTAGWSPRCGCIPTARGSSSSRRSASRPRRSRSPPRRGPSSPSRGIDLGGEQQMKTRTALEYFSKQLTGGKAKAERPREGNPVLVLAYRPDDLIRRARAGDPYGCSTVGTLNPTNPYTTSRTGLSRLKKQYGK